MLHTRHPGVCGDSQGKFGEPQEVCPRTHTNFWAQQNSNSVCSGRSGQSLSGRLPQGNCPAATKPWPNYFTGELSMRDSHQDYNATLTISEEWSMMTHRPSLTISVKDRVGGSVFRAENRRPVVNGRTVMAVFLAVKSFARDRSRSS